MNRPKNSYSADIEIIIHSYYELEACDIYQEVLDHLQEWIESHYPSDVEMIHPASLAEETNH